MTLGIPRTVCIVLALIAAPLSAQDAPDAAIIGGRQTYVVKAGDSIAAIAARHAVAPGSIVARNAPARSAPLVAGQIVEFDNSHIASRDPRVAITINVPQRLLFARQDDHVTAYPITAGRRDWPTPLGDFTIVDKERDPAWDVPLSIQREMERLGRPVVTRMEPSPANPLGAYWMRLSFPGIGIHGTNAPDTIYQLASHGCIRMHPDDIAALFNQVAVGTRGAIVYQPIIMAVMDGQVWLEAHRDAYGLAPDRFSYVRALADQNDLSGSIDWSAADRVLNALAGRAEDVTKRD